MKSIIWSLASVAFLGCGSSDKGIAIHNTPPVVSFTSPTEGEAFELGEPVEFMASVEDKESGPEDLELEWVSNIQGLLEDGTIPDADGMASFRTAELVEGMHTVTIKATDYSGRIGEDYMTVRIESNCLEYLDCDDDGDGFTEDDGDCDDADAARHPDAEELYNEIDDDCDGIIDEGTAGYDDDGDGYSEIEDDCDDTDETVYSGAEEIADGIDNDCDDLVDEGTDTYDDDGDGYSEAEGDCDDTDPEVSPEGIEVFNGVDDDCDGLVDEGTDIYDDDGDGFAEVDGDCDDADASIHPLAIEECDDIDNDCDGDIDEEDLDTDQDEDGYSACDFDCDDDDPDVHPDAPEICDEIDNDCDDEIDADDPDTDMDEDGYGICDEEADCNDDDDLIFPGAGEICDAFGEDEDCDGLVNEPGADGSTTFYVDEDGDGFGVASATDLFCSLPEGYSRNGDDCDDTRRAVSPDGTEVCGDGLDNDCDGAVDGYDPDTDADGDGYSACAPLATNTDCDDSKADIFPGATELCGDSIDNDCDGETDEPGGLGSETFYLDADSDGYGNPGMITEACSMPEGYVANGLDCNDAISEIKPGATEVCDGVDNDCNGDADVVGVVDAATWYYDGDGDGYGSSSSTACTAPADHVAEGGDCNDGEASAYPGATEYCDGILNDCDSTDPDGLTAVDHTQWYRDYDDDGYPRSSESVWACDPPDGYLAAVSEWDCDDYDADINAGSNEVCGDGEDNDCDTQVDEPGADGCVFYHLDGDEDGYGASDSMCLCDAGDVTDYDVTNDNDCYDDNDDARPTATAWHSTDRGDGSFDYSCDGVEEQKWPSPEHSRGECALLGSGSFACGFVGDDATNGWNGSAPECGESKKWYSNCRFVVETDWPWSAGCKWTKTDRTQQCR